MGSRHPHIPGTRAGRVLYVLPAIADELDEATKDALALCNAEGRCPCCGARGELHPDRELEGLSHYVFRHESWCSALTDEAAAIRTQDADADADAAHPAECPSCGSAFSFDPRRPELVRCLRCVERAMEAAA